MGRPLRVAWCCAASTVLPSDPRRRSHAEAWLEQVLREWGLEPALGGRWLVAADTHLRISGDLRLCAEYDPDLKVFTLEIRDDRRRIYGIDDWLG